MMVDRIICGDALEELPAIPEDSIDAVITDPPYELVSGRTTDRKKSGGFMGKAWDGTGIAYDVSMWQECLRVLKPGGHMLAFGGTRTYHRMACAIEDAGFEIRDSLHWVYGCLSPDTEIMINGQWERYQKANIGDLTICYNNETNSYSWQPIQEVFEYRIKDTAYRIQSDLTDQIVTRGHRCLIERAGKLLFCFAEEAAREREIYVPVLEDLHGLLEALPMSHARAGTPEHDVLLGLCKNSDGAGEGRAAKEGQYRTDMPGLRQDVSNLESMGEAGQNKLLLTALQRYPSGRGLEEARAQGPGGLVGADEKGLCSEDNRAGKLCMEGRRDLLQNARELCGREICPMPSEVLINGPERRLCDGAPLNSCSENEAMLKEVRGCASYQSRPNRQPIGESSAIQDQPGPQEIRGAGITRTTLARIEPIEYDGPVWCVRVPTGAFVARRNGKIFVTGNSGFPKSLSIGRAIDKMEGNSVGSKYLPDPDNKIYGSGKCKAAGVDRTPGAILSDPAISDAAKQWAGYGTALKPAHEPIVLARKPLSESTIAGNVLKWGCGGLNIDASRIAATDFEPKERLGATKLMEERPWNRGQLESGERKTIVEGNSLGRFPANLIWSHSPNCKRIGTKKVKGDAHFSYKPAEDGGLYKLGLKQLEDAGNPFADADGMETVESWDCAPDCPSWEFAKAGERKSGGADRIAGKSNTSPSGWKSTNRTEFKRDPDTGSAARFFKSCQFTEEDIPAFTFCALCNKLIYQKHHVKNEVLSCNVNGAEKSSSQGTEIADSVATPARQRQQHESGAKSDKLNIHASSAAKSLSSMPETNGCSAPRNVNQSHIEKIAQNVRSAETLCDSCETAIVQGIVAMQQGHCQELLQKWDFISEPKGQILYQSLALFAETQENIATIPTIPSLKMWFGYVNHAIENYTRQEKAERTANIDASLPPFRYCSKASRAEREQGLDSQPYHEIAGCYGEFKVDGRGRQTEHQPAKNNHPTVKPLALMRYLCRLICPPNGIILDPFAGSGTTCLAATLEGFGYVGIEKEVEYCEIARRRVSAIPARLDRWSTP